MDSGNLRDRITFQIKAEATGPFQHLDDFEDYVSTWAEVRFLRGKNFYEARAANVKTDVEFVIRHRQDLEETMRIKFDNEYYNIEGILPLDSRKMYLIVKAYNIKHDM